MHRQEYTGAAFLKADFEHALLSQRWKRTVENAARSQKCRRVVKALHELQQLADAVLFIRRKRAGCLSCVT